MARVWPAGKFGTETNFGPDNNFCVLKNLWFRPKFVSVPNFPIAYLIGAFVLSSSNQLMITLASGVGGGCSLRTIRKRRPSPDTS